MNRPIFCNLALSRRSNDDVMGGERESDGLRVPAAEQPRGSGLPEYFKGAERIDISRAIVLFLKVQIRHFKIGLAVEVRNQRENVPL